MGSFDYGKKDPNQDSRFSGSYTTDAGNVLGDPAGWLTGTNSGGAGGVKKMLFGDPDAIKKAYDQAMSDAKQGGRDITNFLMHQQGRAQQYYAPLQHMFSAAYGTEGLQAPQTPQAPGGPLSRMYGGQ